MSCCSTHSLSALLFVLTAFSGTLACASFTGPSQPDATTAPPAWGSYAVVVSQETYAIAEWKQVVETLRKKHDAAAIVYSASVGDAKAELGRLLPRYACFVARPEECGRDFVVSIHRLTRQLDDDPYTDVIWGILTGYDAADALRIAGHGEPLIVRRALGGCSAVDLDAFDEGIRFDEGTAGERWVKAPGGRGTRENWSPDSTKGLVDAFNEFKPDAFYTSGHATEHDWQIGYNYKDGSFRCQDGQLFGLDTQGQRFDIHSPNPKVYLPMGNCLIGHVPGRDCMALALMHTGGVYQMFGYTAVTFFGFMGWGVYDYFEGQRGRYTLAECFYAINQALLYELETRHPRIAQVDLARYDERAIGQLAQAYHLKSQDEVGLLWDRDVVAFYGDPAWEVRRPRGDPGWRDSLTEREGVYTLTITATRDGQWSKRPLLLFLPERLEEIHVMQGEELMPIVTDKFVLLPLTGEYHKGDVQTLIFQARKARLVRTSAATPPITAVAPEPAATTAPAETRPAALPADVPSEYRTTVAAALARAGDNAPELVSALTGAPALQRTAVCFLIANMPHADLRALKAAYLLENVAWAYQAREDLPWGKDIPDELFLNDVLPYASINERRDNWRKDFYERFRPLVRDCRSAGEAAQKLNREVFPLVKVQYHATKRPKADQSPYESIEAGYASCTGLSVLLTDACRAVCVPARLAGTPQWVDHSGNHSWVEVWDRQWYFVGAAEPDAAGLNHAWFIDAAANADAGDPTHWIYATSFKKTDLSFPLVWNLALKSVSARDVTTYYTSRKKVRIRVLDRPNGAPVAARLILRLKGVLYAQADFASSGSDGNQRVEFELPSPETFEVVLEPAGVAEVKTSFATTDEKEQEVTLTLTRQQ